MKFLFVAVFFVVVAAAWCKPADLYTDEFDNINEDEILASDRLVNNYINCAKTGKKCTPDGKKFREIIPDALKTRCAKCTEVQKNKSKKILHWVVKNKPDDFLEIEKIFDPEHKYRNEYADELKKDGIVLPPLKKK